MHLHKNHTIKTVYDWGGLESCSHFMMLLLSVLVFDSVRLHSLSVYRKKHFGQYSFCVSLKENRKVLRFIMTAVLKLLLAWTEAKQACVSEGAGCCGTGCAWAVRCVWMCQCVTASVAYIHTHRSLPSLI